MNGNDSSEEDVEEDNDNVEIATTVEDKYEDNLDMAKSIYNKLRTYIEFHGLDFLNFSPEICISSLIPLL